MSSAYWQIISERAAVKAFEKENPFCSNLVSAEPSSRTDIFSYAESHRDRFLSLLKVLSPECQEIAIEYILLRKTEKQIAILHGKKSQSMIGREIAVIVKVLGSVLARGTCAPETVAVFLESESLDRSPQSIIGKPKKTQRIRNLSGRIFRDPHFLGQFEIDVRHPKIASLFTPRARQVSNASQV
jgi:hypothetical protein